MRLSLWVTCLAISGPLHAAGLLAVHNPANIGHQTAYYADVEAFQGDDAVPIRQYGDPWQGPYTPKSGTGLGLLAIHAETGAQWSQSRLGYVYRADALVKANRDTHDLVWQYDTNHGYDTGRTYRIDYHIQGFEAEGLRYSHQFSQIAPSWTLNMGAGFELLDGRRVKMETIMGRVVTTPDFGAIATRNSIDGQMDISGAGAFNPPYGARPGASGQGYAFDLGLTWRHQNGWVVEAAVNDIGGRMHWRNLPAYVADYNTATQSYDDQGYVHFNPTATAQSSYVDLEQTMNPKTWLAVRRPIGPFEVQLARSGTQGQSFPELGLIYTSSALGQFGVYYDTHFGTFQLGLQSQRFEVSIRSDRLDWTQAKAYGLVGGLHLGF